MLPAGLSLIMLEYSACLMEVGNGKEAIEAATTSLELRKRAHGQVHQTVVQALRQLANAYGCTVRPL
eukprot:1196417-Prorocentrum_minimum.AAC.3